MITGYFIIICILFIAVYWIGNAFSGKRVVERRSYRSWAMRITAIIVVGGSFFLFKHGWAGPAFWERSFAVGVAADVLTLLGVIVMVWSRRILGSNWSGDIVLKQDHELIMSGPYAYVRHPIYGGLLLVLLGCAVFYGYLGGFALFTLFLFGAWFKAWQEEKVLMQHFPVAYLDYRKRVSFMLIPFIL